MWINKNNSISFFIVENIPGDLKGYFREVFCANRLVRSGLLSIVDLSEFIIFVLPKSFERF